MSLMTQSLKRLAAAGQRFDREPVLADSLEPAAHEEDVPIADGLATPPVNRGEDESKPPEQPDPSSSQAAVPTAGDTPHAPEESLEPPPAPLNLPPAAAKLRTAVVADVGLPSQGEDGKLIVLISIQADRDIKSATATLTRALVGSSARYVLSLNAAPTPTTGATETSTGALHGFTSLIDGTRDVEDVILRADASGVGVIPFGMGKGSDQVVDPAAVERTLADCRSRFAFTVVNGGPFQNEHLPLVARTADAVYVVVRLHATERQTAREAVKSLADTGIHARGCIVTGVSA